MNFQSSESLGITQKEKDALIAVMNGMRNGRFRHVEHVLDIMPKDSRRVDFNMGNAHVERDCGTVCCIGGWVYSKMSTGKITARVNGEGADDYVRKIRCGDPLYHLYYPWTAHVDWSKITPREAAKAIENFLLTGKPKWEEVTKKTGTED